MDSLDEEIWDVVIAGTSLPQSLLALSLSRSGKKVLHVDRNGYYGGEDAGFSLQDAREWVEALQTHPSSIFSDANIEELQSDSGPSVLRSARSYTLSLNPQIIYAQSKFLPTLVSSQIHFQLEFLAVGSWFVHRNDNLQKIPSTREDVFNDESLSMRDKRSLMKFLRYVLQKDSQDEARPAMSSTETLSEALSSKFKVPAALQAPIMALALSSSPSNHISLENATQRIRRHMLSVGYFGPGFGGVIPKYGGNAEIAQVACRAQAVGGGAYLLGHGVDALDLDGSGELELVKVKLSDGTQVRARWVVGGVYDLPSRNSPQLASTARSGVVTQHSIHIVADPLKDFFPATSENGPVPAVAIVLVEYEDSIEKAPIYLQIHSEDSGECPPGQCVIYGSMQSNNVNARSTLLQALNRTIAKSSAGSISQPLWSLFYRSARPASYESLKETPITASRLILLPTRTHDISLQDDTLSTVEAAHAKIIGAESEIQPFLRFEEREQEQEDGA